MRSKRKATKVATTAEKNKNNYNNGKKNHVITQTDILYYDCP